MDSLPKPLRSALEGDFDVRWPEVAERALSRGGTPSRRTGRGRGAARDGLPGRARRRLTRRTAGRRGGGRGGSLPRQRPFTRMVLGDARPPARPALEPVVLGPEFG